MTTRGIVRIVALAFLILASAGGPQGARQASAQLSPSPARLEVWSPDLHSSNITSLSPAFQPGGEFTARVNVTNAGPLLGFDVTLNYNITFGPNVLQARCYPTSTGCAHPSPVDPLAGGLFDPNGHYPSACSVIVAKSEIDIPAGTIRYAAVMQGGCTVPGTGTLFTTTFNVTGVGATSIAIVQYHLGKVQSSLIGGVGNPPVSTNVPYDAFSAYFRNKPGIPPTPSFTFPATEHLSGGSVLFNATQTVDTDNPSIVNHGIQTEPIVYDANNDHQYESEEPVIYGTAPANGSWTGAPPGPPCNWRGCTRDRPDPHLVYADMSGSGHWVQGDSVVYDSNENGVFDDGDWVITGPPVVLGTKLSLDTLITYVDLHANNMWDNGYVWDFRDGSSLINTGNVTSHVFQVIPATSTSGYFEVKLVVYDSDNGLVNQLTQKVFIGAMPVFDISATIALSKTSVVPGAKLGVTVTLTNTGNRIIQASMIVTYNFNTMTTLDNRTGITLLIQAHRTYNYTIDTSKLPSGVYTVTVKALVIDITTGEALPNAFPDNVAAQSFTVLIVDHSPPPSPNMLAAVVLLGGGGAVLVVSAAVYLVRRRRPTMEGSSVF